MKDRDMILVALGIAATMAFGSLEVQGAEVSDYTIAELLEPCVEGDNDSRWGQAAEAECEQYIIGFTDAYLLLAEELGKRVCLPEGNRPDEVRWAFMKWAHRHYDRRGMPAAEGLAEVITSEFPCS